MEINIFVQNTLHAYLCLYLLTLLPSSGELGYDRLNGMRKVGLSYAKIFIYIWHILDMHRTGTKHIVCHIQKSVVQWSVISEFTCTQIGPRWKRYWEDSTITEKGEWWIQAHGTGGRCTDRALDQQVGTCKRTDRRWMIGNCSNNKVKVQSDNTNTIGDLREYSLY